MSTRKFLFICGCPRSGTTALWDLMTSHKSVVLGIERFVHFSFSEGTLKPERFNKEQFFRIAPGDTFYESIDTFGEYYKIAEQKYSDAVYVGDKSPPFYRIYEKLGKEFPGCEVLFIIRNIFDVAASYQKRAVDPNDATWSPTMDYRWAVNDWRESLEKTNEILNRANNNINLNIVSYEDIFIGEENINKIFNAIGLDVTPEVMHNYEMLLIMSKEHEARRGDGLTSMERNYISLHAPFDLYRQIYDRRLLLR